MDVTICHNMKYSVSVDQPVPRTFLGDLVLITFLVQCLLHKILSSRVVWRLSAVLRGDIAVVTSEGFCVQFLTLAEGNVSYWPSVGKGTVALFSWKGSTSV